MRLSPFLDPAPPGNETKLAGNKSKIRSCFPDLTDEATRVVTLTSGFRPLPDDLLKLCKAVGQWGRPGLQDQG